MSTPLMRAYIGIDPGVTGAIACISDRGHALVLDLPISSDGTHRWVDGHALSQMITEMPLAMAEGVPTDSYIPVYVERTHAMPGQGVSSMFAMGMVLGSILAGIQASRHSITMVPASSWKRASKLSKDKMASLAMARLKFPHAPLHLMKHHNRAEALLLADWGRLHG